MKFCVRLIIQVSLGMVSAARLCAADPVEAWSASAGTRSALNYCDPVSAGTLLRAPNGGLVVIGVADGQTGVWCYLPDGTGVWSDTEPSLSNSTGGLDAAGNIYVVSNQRNDST